MNKALIFLSGLVVGAGAGIFGSLVYLEKKFEKKYKEQIGAMEEYYGKVDEYSRDNYFSDAEVNPVNDEPETNSGRDTGPLPTEARNDIRDKLHKNYEVTTNYAAMYNGKKDPDDISEEERKADELAESIAAEYERNKDREPRLISSEKLGELMGYTTETLFYYMDDDVVTTEDEEVIEDYERILGDTITKYNFDANDERVIYVQNFAMTTVYEVQKVFGPYVHD